jgi:hypothetical protein
MGKMLVPRHRRRVVSRQERVGSRRHFEVPEERLSALINFEDFGSARLTRGRATVKLDADFARVVKLNGYRVFLTPEGDCQGLYVRSKRGTSFEVHELQGGTSNVAFSYRIVAKRKDIKAHTRFAKIDTTVPVPTGKPRAARGRKAARLPSPIRKLLAVPIDHAARWGA